MIVCNQCGNSIDESLRFCTECGAESLSGYEPQSQPTVVLKPSPQPQDATAVIDYREARRAQSPASPERAHALGMTAPQIAPPNTAPFAPRNTASTTTTAAGGVVASPSSRTALIAVAAVVGAVLLLVLGGIGSHLLFGSNPQEKNPGPTTSEKGASAAPGLSTTSNQVAATTNNNSTSTTVPTMNAAAPPVQTTNAGRSVIVSQPAAPVQVDNSALKQGVLDTLNGWAAASRAHDLNTHMSYYADTLDTYFGRRGVSASYVRADRARAYTRYNSLDIQLSNIAVTVDPYGTTATAIFDKKYSFAGDKILSGAVQQMVWLTRIAGRWRITGEKDLRVYYVNK